MQSISVIKRERSTPVYNIGMTSRLTGLPIHTLRWIEAHELVYPSRTEGNQRLFSEADVELIQQIRGLMEQHVNLPGIRIILNIKAAKPAFSQADAKRKARIKRKI